MSKTPEPEDRDAKDDVLYFEAELASLKEELTVGPDVMKHRKEFVKLRIARIEKQLPDLREKAGKAKINAEWLARVNHPKRG
jgi:hypothetical protein